MECAVVGKLCSGRAEGKSRQVVLYWKGGMVGLGVVERGRGRVEDMRAWRRTESAGVGQRARGWGTEIGHEQKDGLLSTNRGIDIAPFCSGTTHGSYTITRLGTSRTPDPELYGEIANCCKIRGCLLGRYAQVAGIAAARTAVQGSVMMNTTRPIGSMFTTSTRNPRLQTTLV